ncbi:MAG: RidA family protein [Candidatus Hodarchaeota archaeon]
MENEDRGRIKMKKEIILSEKIPKPLAPYSPGIKAGNFIFTAGQVGIDPKTGQLKGNSVKDQTEQCLKNIATILEAAGSSLEYVVKTTVFLADMSTFKEMNETYAKFFPTNPPARSTVQAALVTKEMLVEIEAVAIIP